VRFATDDRVTVTDPSHWNYGQSGTVTEMDFDGFGQRFYGVTFANGLLAPFTVDQLDFTEEAPKA
jgi:hypothetical protein